MTRSSSPSWMRLLAGAALAWLGISVLMAAQDVAGSVRPPSWLGAWWGTVTRWGPGLVLTLAMFALARAAPVRGPHWKRHLALHAGAALVLTGLGVAMQQGLLRVLRPNYAARIGYLDGIQGVLRQRGVLFLMLYAGLVGLYHAVDGARPETAPGEPPDAGPESAEEGRSSRIGVRTGDAVVPRDGTRRRVSDSYREPLLEALGASA